MTNWTPRASNAFGAPFSPQISEWMLPGGSSISFSFGTLANRTYRVEYAEDLEASSWLPLGGNRLAVGSKITIIDPIGPGPGSQRFYRVVLLP
jgi:hypothetical protein